MTREEQIFAYKELRKNGQAFFIDTYEDADRIIEALELTKGLSEANTSNPMYEIGYKNGASDMENAKQIIIDKFQQQIPKWHLVADGDLPNDRRTVLVVAYWHETYQVMEGSYFGDGLWWCVPFNNCGEHMQKLNPKAWMELPKFEEIEI